MPRPSRRLLRPGLILAVLAGYVGVSVLWQVAAPGNGALRSLVANLIFLPIGLAGSALAFRASRDQALDARTRRAWALLTAALTCYLLGDLAWVILQNGLGIQPFPSVADIGYLAFYPLVLWGFLSFPSELTDKGSRLKFWLDAATVLLAGWMLVWYFVIGPVAADAGSTPVQTLLSIAYPVGDLLVLFGVAAVLLRRPAVASRRALSVLAVGAGLFVVADTAFSYLDFNGAYAAGDWPDTLWMLAQASFVYAAAIQVARTSNDDAAAADGVSPAVAASKLPYVAVGAGYSMLLVAARGQDIYPVGGMLIAAVGVTGLVLARQMTVLRDNGRLMRTLHELVTTDALTGLKTRRAFEELAEREFAVASRHDRELAAIMLDVDHFKHVNDSYGHDIGDEVLRRVGDTCRSQVRATDIVGRLGGDEIVLLLPGSSLEDAERAAQRICRAVEARPVRIGERIVPVTTSLGVAGAHGCASIDELLRKADAALYAAKAAGRNRLHIASTA